MDNNLKPEADLKKARANFSKIGGAAALMLLLTIGGQILITLATQTYAPQLMSTEWYGWVSSQAPMYLLALPFFCLIVLPIKKSVPEDNKLTARQLFIFLAMSITFMYAGNLIGTRVVQTIDRILGRQSGNLVTEALLKSNMLVNFVIVGLLAPLIEEFIFRKVIIDRTRMYGEKTAIFVSALIFALFHGNLNQFFYAFGIGLVFGYIYVRTGRMRYTVILHMIINSFFGVFSAWVIGNIDLAKLLKITEELGFDTTEEQRETLMKELTPMLPYISALVIYSFALIGMAVTGLVMLLKRRKNIHFQDATLQLPREKISGTVFMNVGMIALVALCVGLITINIVGQ